MNDENRMTNDELNPNDETRKGSVIVSRFVIRASTFLRHSTFELRHSFPLVGCDTIHSIHPASVTDSLFGGLGVKGFSHLLIEGVAFAFGRETFVFRLNICFALL